MASFVGLSHYFYQGVRLMHRWKTSQHKMEEIVGFGPQGATKTYPQALDNLFTYRPRSRDSPLQYFRILLKLFISPASPRISKISKSAQNDPREPKPFTWATSTSPNLGPSAKYLAWICTKEMKWFQTGSCRNSVRTIYHQPAQKLKNRQDRDLQKS